MRYFYGSLAFTFVCLGLGALLGFATTGTLAGAASTLFICAVLGVMEVSLSFDNAIVNATVLRDMAPAWRRRFLTWGVLIAVFGMRILFPLLIVAVAAHINPVEALSMALAKPGDYARILAGAHVGISGFGGAFLMMVGLKFFFDGEKEVHWVGFVERRLQVFHKLEAIEVAVVLLVLFGVSRLLGAADALTFVTAGVLGLAAYIGVDALGALLQVDEEVVDGVRRAGLGAFLYLEVLDASFSFDGVIGAFALSTNLFVIGLGLGIGAMFVRSLTVMFVEKGVLSEYRFLEHGAFWAILSLAGLMFAQVRVHVPEAVTGLVGAALIGLALWSSVLWKRRHPEAEAEADGEADEPAPPLTAAVAAVPHTL